MTAEILSQLWQSTLAVSWSIILIMIARVPLRRAFGARAACWVWTLVPLSLLAALLPHPQESLHGMATLEQWSTAVPKLIGPASEVSTFPAMIAAAWLLGSIAMLCATAMRQQRFLRSLGLLARSDNGPLRSPALTSPLVVGALRPRLVVPSGFEHMYPEQRRALMLAHEQKHLERHDTRVAAAAALLVCVFWFNPLVYIAVRLLRMDQEMACDAATIARCGVERKLYAEALLDTQLAGQFGIVLPVGCHWSSAHPLKARISLLKSPLPGRHRMMAGVATVALIGTGAATALWSAQPATNADDVVVLSMQWMAQEPITPGNMGRTFRLSMGNKLVPLGTELVSGIDKAPYNVACTPRALAAAADGAAQWRFECRFLKDGKVLAQPTITTSEGMLPSIDMTDPESGVRFYFVVNASSSPERIRLARQNAAREAAMPPAAPVVRPAPATPQTAFP